MAGESTPEPTADLETATRGVASKRVLQRFITAIKAFSIFQAPTSQTLKQHGVEISVARRGCSWENGYAERLIRTLKEEEVHLNDYEDITEARERIKHFITKVYHQKLPHSALGTI